MDLTRFVPAPDAYARLAAYQIKHFFEQFNDVSQRDCDEHAADLVDDRVCPTTTQGHTSYTLVASNRSAIVQFRSPTSQIDLDVLDYARKHYGQNFVCRCVYLGVWHELHVYKFEFVAGEALESARRTLYQSRNERILRSTIQDYAKFFSSSWTNSSMERPRTCQRPNLADYQARLDRLTGNLPAGLLPKLSNVRGQIWQLFDGKYPLVLNHIEPTENNILVDCTTGHITGIVDWPGATFGPFGESLWAVDMALGIQTQSGWHWHDNHVSLRRQFWTEFLKRVGVLHSETVTLIKLGRALGLFLAFGYCNGAPVEAGNASLICLDALFAVDGSEEE